MESEDILHTLITKKLGGNITPEEDQSLSKLLASQPEARREYEEMQKIWEASPGLSRPQKRSLQARWEKIEQNINNSASGTSQNKKIWIRYAAVAAGACLLLVLYFYKARNIVTLATSKGETKTFTLPDGSLVTLNESSTLEYNTGKWEKERHVQVEGEIFFDVQKNGKSFIAESENARIIVIGTSFNIQATEQSTTVTCVTGIVSVDNKSRAKSAMLTAGTGATVEGNNVSEIYRVNTTEVIGWMNEGLDFRNTSLTKVFQTLEQHFNTVIVVRKEVDNLTFTGNLESGTLSSALQTVCLSAGLEYSVRSDSTIVVE